MTMSEGSHVRKEIKKQIHKKIKKWTNHLNHRELWVIAAKQRGVKAAAASIGAAVQM